MRIKKITQGAVPANSIYNGYSTSQTDVYSCDYVNNQLLNTFLDRAHPVGSYYETDNANFDPNNSFVGTWTREDDGTALVSYKSSGAFNKSIGSTTGSETVTLTSAQSGVPAHSHGMNGAGGHDHTNQWDGFSINSGNQFKWVVINGGSNQGVNTSWVGDHTHTINNNSAQNASESHNNIQPSKVVYRWHRTA